MFTLSFDTGKRVDTDLCGARGEEGPGALAGGGAGGKDIVNQQKLFILHAIGPRDGERPLDVVLPFSPTPALGLRGSNPFEHAPVNVKTEAAPDLPRQERRLVKTSRTLPPAMERNRNQQIKFAGIEQTSGRLDHQTTQMTAKCTATAVLQ